MQQAAERTTPYQRLRKPEIGLAMVRPTGNGVRSTLGDDRHTVLNPTEAGVVGYAILVSKPERAEKIA